MKHNTDSHRFASNAALIAVLHQIKSTRRGWDSIDATELFAYAGRRFSGIARSEGIGQATAAADVAKAVWELWADDRIFAVAAGADAKPWAWTAAAVRRVLAHESEAARLLTSVNARSRVDYDNSINFADDALDSAAATRAQELHGYGVIAASSQRPVFRTLALRTAVKTLVNAGHSELIAEAAVEAVAELGSACSSLISAADRAKRAASLTADDRAKIAAQDLPEEGRVMSEALGINAATWRTLVLLVLGGTTGTTGLVAAEHEGLDFSEVKNIRNATRRLQTAA